MKVNFLIFLSVAAVCAAAPDKRSDGNELDSGESRREFRLPNNTMPLRYNLRIVTNIHTGSSLYNGILDVRVKVLETSNTITLHSRNHIITQILISSNRTTIESNPRFSTESDTELLTITTRQQLQQGDEVNLMILFTALMDTVSFGFIQNSYIDPVTRQRNWFATTSFKPTSARRAFPCYDEIRFLTPFDLTMQHHRSYHALSNMPAAGVPIVIGETALQFFQTTPPMPTYLVTFTISNFDHIAYNSSRVPMRVFAQPSVIARGQADNVLMLGDSMLTTMESLLNISYPLPKSDVLAIPGISFRDG
jgi:aminopeptidase N